MTKLNLPPAKHTVSSRCSPLFSIIPHCGVHQAVRWTLTTPSAEESTMLAQISIELMTLSTWSSETSSCRWTRSTTS